MIHFWVLLSYIGKSFLYIHTYILYILYYHTVYMSDCGINMTYLLGCKTFFSSSWIFQEFEANNIKFYIWFRINFVISGHYHHWQRIINYFQYNLWCFENTNSLCNKSNKTHHLYCPRKNILVQIKISII